MINHQRLYRASNVLIVVGLGMVATTLPALVAFMFLLSGAWLGLENPLVLVLPWRIAVRLAPFGFLLLILGTYIHVRTQSLVIPEQSKRTSIWKLAGISVSIMIIMIAIITFCAYAWPDAVGSFLSRFL